MLQTGTRAERLRAVQDIASEYKIARTLPKKGDGGKERLEPILDDLSQLRDESTMVETVRSLQRALSAYGNPLSAASKLLWHYRHDQLINGEHVCIYDSRAFEGIYTCHRIMRGDYGSFVTAWRSGYVKRKGEIAEACEDLVGLSRFLRYESQATKSKLKVLTSQEWFRERVFDFMLWLAKDGKEE